MSILTICWMVAGRRSLTTTRSAKLDRLIDIVGNKNNCFALGFPDAQQFATHDEAGDGVEGAEGFIEKEHVGVDGKSPRYFEPLLHAAGECRR